MKGLWSRKSFRFDWKADQVVAGSRSTLRPVEFGDLDAMALWPRNEDPSEAPYADFPRDRQSMEKWFHSRTSTPYHQMWTVLDQDQVVAGRVGIVLVDPQRKEGLLSIRIRKDRTGRGLGHDCLVPLLDHWFITLGMKVMVLDVSILNQRAIRLYEKLGFHLIGYHWLPIQKEHIVEGVSDAGFIRFMDMQLNQEDWQGGVE